MNKGFLLCLITSDCFWLTTDLLFFVFFHMKCFSSDWPLKIYWPVLLPDHIHLHLNYDFFQRLDQRYEALYCCCCWCDWCVEWNCKYEPGFTLLHLCTIQTQVLAQLWPHTAVSPCGQPESLSSEFSLFLEGLQSHTIRTLGKITKPKCIS